MTDAKRQRVVFDTNTVISALVFTAGRLVWLREHWRERRSIALVSHVTVAELKRVLGYRKLKLSAEYQYELLSDYLSYCETIEVKEICPIQCRDAKDQPLLDLAQSGKADILVTGDRDLLALAGQTAFLIETPEAYWRMVCGDEEKP
ncbi:MAG TPA: putative toxin-antitoxin system toxin component, PIN family [Terracidiphilus sp.]